LCYNWTVWKSARRFLTNLSLSNLISEWQNAFFSLFFFFQFMLERFYHELILENWNEPRQIDFPDHVLVSTLFYKCLKTCFDRAILILYSLSFFITNHKKTDGTYRLWSIMFWDFKCLRIFWILIRLILSSLYWYSRLSLLKIFNRIDQRNAAVPNLMTASHWLNCHWESGAEQWNLFLLVSLLTKVIYFSRV